MFTLHCSRVHLCRQSRAERGDCGGRGRRPRGGRAGRDGRVPVVYCTVLHCTVRVLCFACFLGVKRHQHVCSLSFQLNPVSATSTGVGADPQLLATVSQPPALAPHRSNVCCSGGLLPAGRRCGLGGAAAVASRSLVRPRWLGTAGGQPAVQPHPPPPQHCRGWEWGAAGSEGEPGPRLAQAVWARRGV